MIGGKNGSSYKIFTIRTSEESRKRGKRILKNESVRKEKNKTSFLKKWRLLLRRC